MIAGLAIKAVLSKIADAIPWKYIVIAGLAAGLFFTVRWGVNHYNTLVNDKAVLLADRERLTKANHELEKRHNNQVAALEKTIIENQQRESQYDENIRIIERQENGDACINSPAIRESLRLRVERRTAGSIRSQ